MYITLLDPILPAHRQLESLRFPFWDSLTPYPDSAWQKANRNLLVVMEDEGVVQDFYTVFVQDGMRGEPWMPKSAHH